MLRLAAALNVWSQHLLERIQCEWFGLECPSFADEFVGSKAVEGFSGEVVPCRAPRRQGRSRVNLATPHSSNHSTRMPHQTLVKLFMGVA